MQALLTLVLLLTAQNAPAADVGDGPKPSAVPISWELRISYLEPRRIEVGGSSYWYLVYTVSNTSNLTQRFFPTFQLVTEDLKVFDTDAGISSGVFSEIKQRHELTHKYLVPPTAAIGDLPSGDDNARESVAVWRADEISGNSFTIYAAGLSGEAKLVRNPAYDATKPESTKVKTGDGREREVITNPKYFTLRKTLELRYSIPGSEAARQQADPQRLKVRWIMR
jgi:hypothetical protein